MIPLIPLKKIFPIYFLILKFNIFSLLLIFKENLDFFFVPNRFALIGTILFIAGFILLLKEKTKIGKIKVALYLILI